MAAYAHYFATTARGLEDLAAKELEELGAQGVKPEFCGVSFEGDRKLLYQVNLWARLPFRILVRVREFACADATALYKGIQAVDWSAYLTPAHTLAVDATGKTDQLNHTHYTALQVKNAIVDQQMAQFGERSNVDTEEPDLRVNVHVYRDRCTLSLDSSGDSLHRRGYRPAMGAAPLKESLAAALIKMTNWTPDQVLVDPLCGSGSLLLEASLIGLNVAPGLFRDRFGFEGWRDFEEPLLTGLMTEAEAAQRRDGLAGLWGSDADPEVVRQAKQNCINCGVASQVKFSVQALDLVEAPAETGVLVCNPPYGQRLGRDEDLGVFYKQLGDVLKQRFRGWTAYILSGNPELAKFIRLKSAQRTAVMNGGIACQWMKYELY
jgi:putative N6-adenine-specific DNA methylase